MSMKDSIITGLVCGFSMGAGIKLVEDIQGRLTFNKSHLYGWFETREDAVEVLNRANKVIREEGRLLDTKLSKICKLYPDKIDNTYGFNYADLHESGWRTIEGFKIIKDKTYGRYMIKTPRPRFK